ncbi:MULTISPECIES: Gfo/Idh/MocA family oxidoreductase [unclassified Arthrobacter]|uniref:Gfo/Idh/MocA family protein n=1 Tax=unclassified Arthrobacter TaxID=235627 RepID=UPI0028831C87|nr:MULTISPECIES: Gfo/Idh/MocA family oxidoreductase [unclassified Arthrobacter]
MINTSARTLRWGILGTGLIAGIQTKDLIENDFTVQAVGSRNLASSQTFSAEHGIATAHGSYESLVSDPEVDIVYVATPHVFHNANAMLALNAGKHVLVEKPFTVNSNEASALANLAASKGLVVLEAMWTRFLPHMVRLRELIQAGDLGEVRKVTADHNQSLPTDPTHRLNDRALGGGALLDLGIYPVSFAVDLLGTPAKIHADASMTRTGVDRQTSVVFSYDGGQQAILDCSLDCAGPNRAAVLGTKGWVEIDSVWYGATAFTRYDSSGKIVERFDEPVKSRGMQFQAAEVERLVRDRVTAGTILPPSDSVAVMTVMDEIRRQIGLVYDADQRVSISDA